MEFEDYLKILASKDGSDLYLSTGAPPCAKFEGVLKPLEKVTMAPGRIKDIAYELKTLRGKTLLIFNCNILLSQNSNELERVFESRNYSLYVSYYEEGVDCEISLDGKISNRNEDF